MKVSLLGFEFEVRFGPTTPTLIRYRQWQTKMRHLKCRIIHDTGWATDEKYPDMRWYYCRQCRDTWFGPKKPGDGAVSPRVVV